MGQLAQNHLVIFYDQRGCGRSICEIDEHSINIKKYIEDLEAIRIALNVEKISLLGHSWGGFLAMHYAIAYPKAVDKLILSNTLPASSDDLALFFAEWTYRMTPYMEQMNEIHNTPGFDEGDPDIVEQLHRLMFRTYCYDPNKADLLNVRLFSADAALRAGKVHEVMSKTVFTQPYDLFYDLYALNAPTLIIHGDYDPIPAQTARAIHNHITGSTFILLEKCGHFPYVERPESYFQHINAFLLKN